MFRNAVPGQQPFRGESILGGSKGGMVGLCTAGRNTSTCGSAMADPAPKYLSANVRLIPSGLFLCIVQSLVMQKGKLWQQTKGTKGHIKLCLTKFGNKNRTMHLCHIGNSKLFETAISRKKFRQGEFQASFVWSLFMYLWDSPLTLPQYFF